MHASPGMTLNDVNTCPTSDKLDAFAFLLDLSDTIFITHVHWRSYVGVKLSCPPFSAA
jgi:hypothetical protein